MRFVWDKAKRRSNLRDHEIDFVDAEQVFTGLTSTFEDDRFSYDERRFVTLGLLDGVPVSIVHTESDEEIRVISFRRLDERQPMKKRSYLRASKTNLRRLRQMKASDVKITPEHPELDVKQIAQAIVRKGLKPV